MYSPWKRQEKSEKAETITNSNDYIKEIIEEKEIINERGNREVIKVISKKNLTKYVNETAKLLKSETLEEKLKGAFKE